MFVIYLLYSFHSRFASIFPDFVRKYKVIATINGNNPNSRTKLPYAPKSKTATSTPFSKYCKTVFAFGGGKTIDSKHESALPPSRG